MRQTKIHQQDAATFLPHRIAGLDIPMQQSSGVNRAERFG